MTGLDHHQPEGTPDFHTGYMEFQAAHTGSAAVGIHLAHSEEGRPGKSALAHPWDYARTLLLALAGSAYREERQDQ